jgi:hypothetical protein
MRLAIIIDNGLNESLLRFTETKLFFDSKNMPRNFFNDVLVVSSLKEANDNIKIINPTVSIILKTGYFLTSVFLDNHKNSTGQIIVDENIQNEVIIYDDDTYIGFQKRCKYPPKSKQLYIVENMLKSILRSKKNIYIQNTEQLDENIYSVDHLYGLASGWKTIHLAKQIGLDNLKSITIYDVNVKQLDYAKFLHSCKQIPCDMYKTENSYGNFSIPTWLDDKFWNQWTRYPVEFKQINLYETPIFLPKSLIWISNVFCFEPSIFEYGWDFLKTKKQILYNLNKESIIIE